jgi:hypothetical protein
MASLSVAAAGASVAIYFFTRRRLATCGFGGSVDGDPDAPQRLAFKNAYKPPNSWLEALFFFAEALRCGEVPCCVLHVLAASDATHRLVPAIIL